MLHLLRIQRPNCLGICGLSPASSRFPPRMGQTHHRVRFLNRLVKQTNINQKTTEFTYNQNGNVLTVKDAQRRTSFTYDNVNRLTSRTDPLQHVETYEYNSAGGFD